jgi:hypothetical protein
MHTPHVHPTMGHIGELGNDCHYLHYPSCCLDLESSFVLSPISDAHSPELINIFYRTGTRSTNSPTTSAFMVYIYIPDSTTYTMIQLLSARFDSMQTEGLHASSAHLDTAMTLDPITAP